MFLSFDPIFLLFLIFLVNFIPGSLISFSLLKEKKLLFIEKLFIGFAIGIFASPFILFLFAIIGVPFSFTLTLFATAIVYLIGIVLSYLNKPWENFELKLELNRKTILSIILLVILLLNFWIRLQSYSPIFFDLDPYFYLYSTSQVLNFGIPPLDDQTAWYPEVITDHRVVPQISYLEAIWYSLYTNDGEYNNYLLALTSSLYPPIAAVLAMFFVYLLVSSIYKREFGLFACAVASFIPILILKLGASEFEIQPYAFFSLVFFFSMYSFALQNKDLVYKVLAAIGLAAIYLGSGSIIIPVSSFIVFLPLQSILLFFKKEKEELFEFFKLNVFVYIFGFLLPTLLLSAFKGKLLIEHLQYAVLAMVLFAGPLYYLKKMIPDTKKLYTYFAGFIVFSLIIFAFTPIGDMISKIPKGGLAIAEFRQPLDRTIQEQGLAGGNLVHMLGFLGAPFNESFSFLGEGLAGFLDVVFSPFTAVSNLLLSSSAQIGNALFGTTLEFSDKVNSPLMVVFFFVIVAVLSSAIRSFKGQNSLFLLFLAIIFPPVFVGLLKSKYTIYAGFLLAVGFGVALGEFARVMPSLLTRLKLGEEKVKSYSKTLILFLILVGSVFSFLQFSYDHSTFSSSSSILLSSTQPRFQDNPLALQEKFQELCNYFSLNGQHDSVLCDAANDPIEFASRGINEQYDQTLCIYSIADPRREITSLEADAFNYRCLRLNDYWIETMEWIKTHPDSNMRVTSWWDYGHWINYFGEKNTVLRNEHASTRMIGEVAHSYLKGTPQELKEFMESHDSEYALFDAELLLSGSGLGGKYGALNYLSCARNNGTDVSKTYMESSCEWEQLWETLFVPKVNAQECRISEVQNGVVVFKQEFGFDDVGNPGIAYNPVYCIGTTNMVDGQQANALYYLDQKYENGDLKLNKGFLLPAGSSQDTDNFNVIYTKDFVWIENGEIKSGWEDRKGQFYDSNLYSAFFLKELEGFDLVFESAGGQVKIFKIAE